MSKEQDTHSPANVVVPGDNDHQFVCFLSWMFTPGVVGHSLKGCNL